MTKHKFTGRNLKLSGHFTPPVLYIPILFFCNDATVNVEKEPQIVCKLFLHDEVSNFEVFLERG